MAEEMVKVKEVHQQSNTLGGIATALGATALGGVALQGIGNTMSRYLGNIGANIGALGGSLPGVAPAAVQVSPFASVPYGAAPYGVPFGYPGYGYGCAPCGPCNEGGYVSKEVMALSTEVAQLKAEKYTDNKLEVANARICELEKWAAVNASRDADYRLFVDREFVHQPKVGFDNRKVHTYNGCCDPCCMPAQAPTA